MATPPQFTAGQVLTAAQMNAVGLWLVKSQAIGSAEASVTVTDAFSADYDNYLIIMNTTASIAQSSTITLGASNTGYYGFLVYGATTSNTVQGEATSNLSSMRRLGGSSGATTHVMSVNVMGPYLAQYTKFFASSYNASSEYGTMHGEHRVATSYTDFTIGLSTGTISGGTVRVYGYRN